MSSTWLFACSSGEDEPPTIQQRVGLEAFSSCEALESHIEDNAVELMRSQLRAGYFMGGAVRGTGGPEVNMDAAAPASQAAAGPTGYTQTNVQVQGVDEADFMKNTGTHIYTISGTRLYVAKSWPPSELGVMARVDLEGYPTSMYLDEERDRLVVLASVTAPYAQVPADASVDCLASGYCGWAVATKVTVFDVRDPASPKTIDELYLPGWLQNSRRIGASVRLVLGDSFRWPENLRWYPDWDEGVWNNELLLQSLLDSLADENEKIIRARTLADWLPPGLRRLEDGRRIEVPYDCKTFHRVNASVDLGFTTVATIHLDDLDHAPEETSIVAATSEVYASLDSLYLATHHWWWWPMPGQEDHTYLFKFDLEDPESVAFVAAGGVEGHILNQFSLDEHQGFLRVATTIASRVKDPDNEWGRLETTNRVSVLAERDGALEVVGRTEDIAKGESITSARFLGTRGFVVTYRQVDPLFTVDLTNPTEPRIVGELKVPGFSSYIHPLGENHLLTIGVHIDEPDQNGDVRWGSRAVKLSIFDVTDFSNPLERFTQLVGTAYGSSEALSEHKAFNFFAERGILAVPFADFAPRNGGDVWGEFTSELRVFQVAADSGITPLGAVSMDDLYTRHDYEGWTWWWSPWVRRSVLADDFAYAVSDAGIRVAAVGDLSHPIATAVFEPSSPGYREPGR